MHNLTMENDSRSNLSSIDYYVDPNFELKEAIRFTLSGLVYLLTFVVGSVGNSLVIFSIFKLKKLQTVTNMFLISLATADLLLIIFCVPIRFGEFFTHSWIFGKTLCKLTHYLQNVSSVCSVFNLTAISLEKYLVIIYPLKAKYMCTRSRTRNVIIIIWILSFLAATPVLIGKTVVKLGIDEKVPICKRIWSSPYWQIFEIYRATILLFLPITIMILSYSRICKELWFMKSVRRQLTASLAPKTRTNAFFKSELNELDELNADFNNGTVKSKKQVPNMKMSSSDDATMKQVVIMLICIVVIFFVCWAPIVVNNLLVAFKVIPRLNVGILRELRLIFFVMSYFNSCVNPIVYAFMSKNFREGFKSVLLSCCCDCCTKANVSLQSTFNEGHARKYTLKNSTKTTGSFDSLSLTKITTANTVLVNNNKNNNFN